MCSRRLQQTTFSDSFLRVKQEHEILVLWRVCTFAQARHFNIMHWLKWQFVAFMLRAAKALASLHICTGLHEQSPQYQHLIVMLKWRFFASSEGSGESAHLHRLASAFVTVPNLTCWFEWRFGCHLCEQRASLHICTFSPQPSPHKCDLCVIYARSGGSGECSCSPQPLTHKCDLCVIYARSGGSGECLCSPQPLTHKCDLCVIYARIDGSCECSCSPQPLTHKCDLCVIYARSGGSGESAPATTASACSHRCVVSMLKNLLLMQHSIASITR